MFNFKDTYKYYEQVLTNNINRVEKLISEQTINYNKVINNLMKYQSDIEAYYKIDFNKFIKILPVDVNDKFTNIPLFQDWVISLKAIKCKLNKLEKMKNTYSNSFVNKDIFTLISETYIFKYVHPVVINNGHLYINPNVSLKVRKQKGRVGVDWQKSLKNKEELESKGIKTQNNKQGQSGEEWLIKYNSDYSIKLNVLLRNIKLKDEYKMKPVISSMFNYDTVEKKLVYQENKNTIKIKNNEDFISKFTYDEIINMNINLYKKLILLSKLQPKLLENYGQ